MEPGAYDTDIWSVNVKIGKVALSGESPNQARARRFSNVVKNRLKKADAREVSQLITRIAQDPDPNLRYLVGRDARTALLVPAPITLEVLRKTNHQIYPDRLVTRNAGVPRRLSWRHPAATSRCCYAACPTRPRQCVQTNHTTNAMMIPAITSSNSWKYFPTSPNRCAISSPA